MLTAALLAPPPLAQPESPPQLVEYRDPQGRFVFSFRASYGSAEVGTDNGFGGRVAAIRFSIFSTGGIGGEAVLNAGRPVLDVLAAGGLYDEIASGTLPDPIRKILNGVLPPLSAANFCSRIRLEQHVDITSPPFAPLTAQQRTAIAELDRMGNYAPRVTQCSVSGDVVVFDKDAGMAAGGPRRRSYGAVKFLTGRYAAFQFVRAGGVADAAIIEGMKQVVSSFRAK
jgi:hypothetical protein